MDNNKYSEILLQASKLFAKKGYTASSMREIAANTGITKATIYHYFKNKEEILFEIMNSAMDKAFVSIEKIKSKNITILEKFTEIINFYSKYYIGNQDNLILLVNDIQFLNSDYKKILIDKEKKYVDLIYDILKEMKSEGKLKDIPLPVVSFAFFGMVHYTINWFKDNKGITVEQLANYFTEIILKGVTNE